MPYVVKEDVIAYIEQAKDITRGSHENYDITIYRDSIGNQLNLNNVSIITATIVNAAGEKMLIYSKPVASNISDALEIGSVLNGDEGRLSFQIDSLQSRYIDPGDLNVIITLIYSNYYPRAKTYNLPALKLGIVTEYIDPNSIKIDTTNGTLKSSWTQFTHGFTPGVAVSYLNNKWVLADASSSNKLGRMMVESVIENAFVGVQVGNMEIPGWNLTPGKFYVVDDSGNGTIAEYVSTENPTLRYSNPVLQALTSEIAQVLPWRPSLGMDIIEEGVQYTQSSSIIEETFGNYSPTGVTLEYTPYNGSSFSAMINDVSIEISYFDRTGDCYFSIDGGQTPRLISELQAGDELYWNSNIAGYDISPGDKVDITYEKNSLD